MIEPERALRPLACARSYAGPVRGMVVAHAPIVLGAARAVRFVSSPPLYGPLVMLHGSTTARVVGDLLAQPRLGALGSALALVLFASTILGSILVPRDGRWPGTRPHDDLRGPRAA